MSVKTRFAPSPTGYLHVGGARTALYSWLHAKANQGEFVLRIEDTDLERSTPEAVEAIMDGMRWLALDWNEGPVFQTHRFERYKEVIAQLVKAGKAYPCFCSRERLDRFILDNGYFKSNKKWCPYKLQAPKSQQAKTIDKKKYRPSQQTLISTFTAVIAFYKYLMGEELCFGNPAQIANLCTIVLLFAALQFLCQ